MNFKIALITPIYNRSEKTKKFISRLNNQVFKNFDLYLVDSGSTDGTIQEINTLKVDFKIVMIQAQSVDYWTSATNIGIKAALSSQQNYNYIVTINDDSSMDDNYLELMCNLALKNNLDILISAIFFENKKNRFWMLGSSFNWKIGRIFYLEFFNKNILDLPISIQNSEIIKVQSGCGNGVFIKKEIFNKIGYFDSENCPHYHADSEYLLRATTRGINVWSTIHFGLYNDLTDKESSLIKILKNKPFTNIKSPYYFKSILYVIQKYAPKKYQFQALTFFYLVIILKGIKSILFKISIVKKVFFEINIFIKFIKKYMYKFFKNQDD